MGTILNNVVTLNLYTYNGMPNTINKQLGTPTTVDGRLRESFSVLRPTLTLRLMRRPTFNYVFIADLGRYYFVTDITYCGNSLYEIDLRVDVLKTYETAIMTARAHVEESDNSNTHISNRQTTYSTLPQFEKLDFPNKELLSEDGSIIMITLKG